MKAGAWVFYDGECAMCRSLVEMLRGTLTKKGFDFAALQEPWVQGRLGLEREELLREMRVLTAEGRQLGGAAAATYLAGFLWWGWPLRLVAKLPGGSGWLERGYQWIAANRACGNGVCRRESRLGWAGWGPVMILPALALAGTWRLEPWVLMWALAVALFAACKWLTWWEAFLGGQAGQRSGAYLTRWVGMDAPSFMDEGLKPLRVRLTSWLFAAAKTFLGAVLLWGVARLIPETHPLWRGWVGMVGGIFFLHFGLLHLLALEWQRRGVMAEPIMNAPILARSLGEFWGQRWNRGFNDLVRRYSFYPLVPRLGVAGAMMATFLVSGLIHDLVIAVPARSGYGLPTMYFLLQGAGVILEKSGVGRWLGLRRGVRGRLFVFFVTIGPAGMLFAPRFVEEVILPFLKFIRAL